MDYKSYFDIPKAVYYLNTPGNGLLPQTHHRWRAQRERDYFDPSSSLRDQHTEFIREVKNGISRLFNCSLAGVYSLPNFSFGYNVLLDGLPKRLKFAILQDDYPSLNYPVKSRGFDFEMIAVHDGNVEERILELMERNKVDVLLLSMVQYISGLKIDLSFIKQLKVSYPDLIIIGDATQFLGTEPFDFLNSGFDAVGGSGYKWMMAGFGNGYFMLSERLRSILYQEAQKRSAPEEAMWAHKSVLDVYFEPGHHDTLAQGTLLQSIYFFEELGLENVKQYLGELEAYAYKKFEERSWLLESIVQRSHRSPVFNLQVPQQVYPALIDNGVRCYPRGSGIRVGLHIYNDKNDVDVLVDILERVIK